ncbi:MAG: amino acid transport protein [Burkholderiaceae bacterium]|nr:MAG: amino acid transport protein [Burkholderiaceae bacterium]
MSASLLFLGLIFGSLGMGYCVYGRRQRALAPFLCGLVLMVVPYVIANALALTAAGALVATLPFFLKL